MQSVATSTAIHLIVEDKDITDLCTTTFLENSDRLTVILLLSVYHYFPALGTL